MLLSRGFGQVVSRWRLQAEQQQRLLHAARESEGEGGMTDGQVSFVFVFVCVLVDACRCVVLCCVVVKFFFVRIFVDVCMMCMCVRCMTL